MNTCKFRINHIIQSGVVIPESMGDVGRRGSVAPGGLSHSFSTVSLASFKTLSDKLPFLLGQARHVRMVATPFQSFHFGADD